METELELEPIAPLSDREFQAMKKQTMPAPLSVNPRTGVIVARDNSELVRLIKTFMAGAALPKSLDTEPKVIAAWQIASSLNVPAPVAIQNMAFINGTIQIWGQLPKALAEATGQLQDFHLFLVDESFEEICTKKKNLKATPWAAVCQIKRKDRSVNEYVFSMDDAKKAGLTSKQGPWQQYTAIMLRRRATAMAIKFEFPDALMGVGVAEYDSDQAPDLKDVTPSFDVANELNKTLTGDPNGK